MWVHHVHAVCPWRPKSSAKSPLELELQVIVSPTLGWVNAASNLPQETENWNRTGFFFVKGAFINNAAYWCQEIITPCWRYRIFLSHVQSSSPSLLPTSHFLPSLCFLLPALRFSSALLIIAWGSFSSHEFHGYEHESSATQDSRVHCKTEANKAYTLMWIMKWAFMSNNCPCRSWADGWTVHGWRSTEP